MLFIEELREFYKFLIQCYHATFSFKGNITIWSIEQMFRNRIFSALYEDEREALDEYHTHFLLFDIGDAYRYLNDDPRSNFIKAMRSRATNPRLTPVREKLFLILN